MYNEHFGFKEPPFSIAPDPRYLYMTAQHREALAHLVYGLNSEGGCILLTGEVGTGKTTICRCLLEQIPEKVNVALLLNPKVNEIELLETICDELKISYPDTDNSVKTYTDRIYDKLIENNRNNESTVLIIDEAQNLDNTVLEQLRLLTNLETDKRKLLQIIILGQPELLDILATTEMRQLAQRITARYHLEPLSKINMKAYVDHRLAIAGQNVSIFPEKSLNLLYKLSNGIPRLINVIADRSLLGAYVENQHTVSPQILKTAAKEVFGELKNVKFRKNTKRWLLPATTIAGITALSILLFFSFKQPIADFSENLFQAKTKPDSTENETQKKTKTKTNNNNIALKKADKKKKASSKANNKSISNTDSTTSQIKPAKSFETILTTSSNSLSSSYEILFKKWGETYNKKSSVTGCQQAEKFSLRCLHKLGGLDTLKKLNRPAVLRVTSPDKKRRYIAITKINKDIATVYSGGKSFELSLKKLDQYWHGQFILLWKTPDEYTASIAPGSTNKMSSWLHKQFNTVANTPGKNPKKVPSSNLYNPALVEKVRTFQKEHQLNSEGIVGPMTIILLNSKSNENYPKLIK